MFLRWAGMTVSSVALGLAHLPLADPVAVTSSLELAGLLLRQVACGLLIGAPIGFALESLATCGRLLDLGRGESIGGQLNPALGVQNSAQEQLYRLLAACFIFTGGAYQLLLSSSLELSVAAVSSSVFTTEGALTALSMFTRSLTVGIILACPVLVTSLVFDLSAGLISKALSRLNIVFEFLPLKLVFGLIISGLVLGLVSQHLGMLLEEVPNLLELGEIKDGR